MAEWTGGVCVLGLGYVGLPTAALLASRGIDVIGVDTDPQRVDAINSGASPISEPGLDRLVADAVASGRLRAEPGPSASDAFIVAVPTPIRRDHGPDLRILHNAVDGLAPLLRPRDLVIVESTSPVGATEAASARLAKLRPDLSFPHTHGDSSDVRVAYCPERVLPGNALVELVGNDRIIGGVSPACAVAARSLYETFVKGECRLTDSRTAELVKLSENAFRDVNIAFANELSIVCDRLGVDPWELISLANRHPRVNILQPGPGVGGHCIPVDPWFIAHSDPERTPLIQAARRVNDSKSEWVASRVTRMCSDLDDPVVACLGLSYKRDSADLRESPSIAVVRSIRRMLNGRILVVEPHVDALPADLATDGACELVGLQYGAGHGRRGGTIDGPQRVPRHRPSQPDRQEGPRHEGRMGPGRHRRVIAARRPLEVRDRSTGCRLHEDRRTHAELRAGDGRDGNPSVRADHPAGGPWTRRDCDHGDAQLPHGPRIPRLPGQAARRGGDGRRPRNSVVGLPV